MKEPKVYQEHRKMGGDVVYTVTSAYVMKCLFSYRKINFQRERERGVTYVLQVEFIRIYIWVKFPQRHINKILHYYSRT